MVDFKYDFFLRFLFQGVQSQDRHLFLFNDLLLIAKARSGGNFKLKEKVRISEIWLTKCCLDDVSELNKSEDTSFVMGWPTTNLVVTFRYLSFYCVVFFSLSANIVLEIFGKWQLSIHARTNDMAFFA